MAGRTYVNFLPEVNDFVEYFRQKYRYRTRNDAINRMLIIAEKYVRATEAQEQSGTQAQAS